MHVGWTSPAKSKLPGGKNEKSIMSAIEQLTVGF